MSSVPKSSSEKATEPSELESGRSTIANASELESKLEDPSLPSRKRWSHIAIVSILALVTNMAPTMCAPGIAAIAADLEITSSVVSTLAITLYVLGLGIGPMVTSPLSEVYGRLPVYHACDIAFVLLLIGNARHTDGPGWGTIADVTIPANRANAMSIFSLGPLLGPVLGPLIGGFVTEGLGWPWFFWLLAIFGGASTTAAIVFLRETNPKILLERKAARLRAATGNLALRSVQTHPHSISPRPVLAGALGPPTKLLINSPILLVMSLYVAFIFGTTYLLFTTFPDVFEGQYGFTVSTSGLAYLGLGVALFVALIINCTFGERVRATRMKADASAPVIFGLFIYSWTAF
ncbi:fluconazole resistance protein 1 [Nemania serpens]|nr:fluconazole resistance protein 1 [Nemania serpens]